ncbi:MAG TPA: LPS export ABC transporter permease LptF [Gammaproteobacteria bacterium]|nr:LPS export ABC transporter permease LptF [Gammaproteobacteria bacterium]
MSLISRYILRETFGAWLVMIMVLFLILMTSKFAEILGDAAGNRLPREAVLAVFALTSMTSLTALTPIAHFLGVMWALARLNRDSEMAALAACGIGPVQLLAPVSTLTFALAAVLSWLALLQTPLASRRIQEIEFRAQQTVQLAAVEPGKFTSPDGGASVLYAGEVNGEQLGDVFYEGRQGDRVVAIRASRAERRVDPDTGQVFFVLFDGRRYEGVPGEEKFLVVGFDEHGIPVRTEAKKEFVPLIASTPTLDLLASSEPKDRAELERRISMPLSVLVLALLAVPLSRSSPREGRYARIGVGLLLYIIYTNLQTFARVWVEREVVPTWLGMWWVHGLALALALLLLGRESGWFHRVRMVAPVPA